MTTLTLSQIAGRIKNYTGTNTHGRGDCPLCGGKNTLSVSENGKLLLHCHKCCASFNDLLQGLNLNSWKPVMILPQRKKKQAVSAAEVWKMATEAPQGHAYLKKKGIGKHGLKQAADGRLIVPVKSVNGTLHGLQFISSDGDKIFLPGTAKKGNFYQIGALDGIVYIAEGFATAASIHEATGQAAICSFDAGNLKPVAEAIKQKYPDATLVICGDNDQFKKENIGLKKAKEAALAVNARLAIPEFRVLDEKATDFNDLAVRQGLNAVLEQVEAAVMPITDKPRLMTLDELLDIQVEIKPVIGKILNVGGGLVLGGRDGVGKSLAALELALQGILNRQGGLWWDTWWVRPVKALFVQSENSLAAVQGRIRRLCGDGETSRKFLKNSAFFAVGNNIRVADDIQKRDFQVIIINLINQLRKGSDEEVLWFLDPLSSFHTVEENSSAMRPVLDCVTAINDATGSSSVVVHHLGKGGVDIGLRGHTSIRDWSHATILMEEKPQGILVQNSKNRDYEKTKDFYVERNSETLRCHKIDLKSDQAEQVARFLADLGGEISGRKEFSAALSGKFNISETTARRRIDDAVKARLIKPKKSGRATGYLSVTKNDDEFSPLLRDENG